MQLLTAFTAMLGDVGYANASARQIDGILDWSDHVARAVARAKMMHARPGTLDVTFTGSATHRTWRVSCHSILAALSAQAEEARVRRAEQNVKAADLEQRAAAEEDEMAAASLRDEAVEARGEVSDLIQWEIAANDAHTFGESVIRNEEPVARRVFEGIQAAGGIREVPADKRYAATARGNR